MIMKEATIPFSWFDPKVHTLGDVESIIPRLPNSRFSWEAMNIKTTSGVDYIKWACLSLLRKTKDYLN